MQSEQEQLGAGNVGNGEKVHAGKIRKSGRGIPGELGKLDTVLQGLVDPVDLKLAQTYMAFPPPFPLPPPPPFTYYHLRRR